MPTPKTNWKTLDRTERSYFIEMATVDDTDYRDEDNRASRTEDAIQLAWQTTDEGKSESAEVRAISKAKREAHRNRELACTECGEGVTALTSLSVGDDYVACGGCLKASGLGHKVTWNDKPVGLSGNSQSVAAKDVKAKNGEGLVVSESEKPTTAGRSRKTGGRSRAGQAKGGATKGVNVKMG